MTMLTSDEIRQSLANLKEIKERLKTDPRLRQAVIAAKDNRLPVDRNRPTPKQRYEDWLEEKSKENAS